MSPMSRTRTPWTVAGAIVLVAGVIALISMTRAGAANTPDLQVSSGPDLRISQVYVPQPASPDVAAAYFTVTNSGDQADTLTAVAGDVSKKTMMHESTGGTMTTVGSLPVPARGKLVFSPGGYHVMLESPTRRLKRGDQVKLTLTFERAGQITVNAPVKPVGYHPDPAP